MSVINLRTFRQKARQRKSVFRRFLSRLQRNPPYGLDKIVAQVDQQVWNETDCLSCANCCKTMSPVYTAKDIRRIAEHLGISSYAFKKKWLFKEKHTGDWLNKTLPCQFLDLSTNMCRVYDVRPVDCSGFPHLTRKRMVDYMHVHKQNLEFCPATYRMVEKMMLASTKPIVPPGHFEKLNAQANSRVEG